MKVALVHDFLIDYGGAERVLSALHEIWPKAPIYVSVYRRGRLGRFSKKFEGTKIVQSWFGFLPFAGHLISPLRFLLPFVWNSFDFKKYDLIITSASWAVTKGMKNAKKEICYLHTPPRHLYGYDTSRVWRGKWYGKLVDLYGTIVNHFMRKYDFRQAQKVDYFVVNSENVGRRVKKFYRRDYKVIYPPVEVEKIIDSKEKPVKGDFFLTGGRIVASKNFGLVIKACQKAGVNLKIFGGGPVMGELKKIAGPETEFLGRISDEKLISFCRGAKAFVLAQRDEDFGITSIEAAAAGCPSIAFQGGGYLETVVENKTGMFFDELTTESLVKMIRKFDSLKRRTVMAKACVAHAKKFSKEKFKKEMLKFVGKHARTT